MTDVTGSLANNAARIRLVMAGRTTDVHTDLLDLLDDWVEAFDAWKAGSNVAVRFAASTTMMLDQMTGRIVAPTAALMPDLVESFSLLGAEAPPVELMARLGAEIEPMMVGAWFHVGGDGVDTGWAFPGASTLGELQRAAAPAELLEWVEGSGVTAVSMLEGSVGNSAYIGGATMLSAEGASIEEMYDGLDELGVERPPARLLVPIEELHDGPVWISAWFVVGEGVVRTGVIAVEPSAELLVAMAMASGADEERIARFGAALGRVLPTMIEVDTWADGPTVRLHFDVRADGLDEDDDDGDDDDPFAGQVR